MPPRRMTSTRSNCIPLRLAKARDESRRSKSGLGCLMNDAKVKEIKLCASSTDVALCIIAGRLDEAMEFGALTE